MLRCGRTLRRRRPTNPANRSKRAGCRSHRNDPIGFGYRTQDPPHRLSGPQEVGSATLLVPVSESARTADATGGQSPDLLRKGVVAWLAELGERALEIRNCYDDDAYADAYAKLEFPGTYYLAFRDLPQIIKQCANDGRALDFGCGAGRSTRFLNRLGFTTVGVDIAGEMLQRARSIDPEGEYQQIEDGNLSAFADGSFDLVLSAFTFDNIATRQKKVALFREFARVLKAGGRALNLVSAPEIYTHEWASFSTRDFPENRRARCGDEVRIVVTALEDRRPAVDVLWPDEDYRDVYAQAGLAVIEVHRPLGVAGEPYEWISESEIAPWVIYVLRRA